MKVNVFCTGFLMPLVSHTESSNCVLCYVKWFIKTIHFNRASKIERKCSHTLLFFSFPSNINSLKEQIEIWEESK